MVPQVSVASIINFKQFLDLIETCIHAYDSNFLTEDIRTYVLIIDR